MPSRSGAGLGSGWAYTCVCVCVDGINLFVLQNEHISESHLLKYNKFFLIPSIFHIAYFFYVLYVN